MPVATDPAVAAAVAAFLFHEAELLDGRRLDEWLQLYREDAIYWIPQGDSADAEHDVSIAYDDRRRLHERVLRLSSGFAYSQDPPSRTVHLIGNVRVRDGGDGRLDVDSSLLVTEVRRNVQNAYAGHVAHRLVPEGDAFRILRKVIRLVNSDVPLGNVTFLI